jgi:hypothetical protein
MRDESIFTRALSIILLDNQHSKKIRAQSHCKYRLRVDHLVVQRSPLIGVYAREHTDLAVV